MLRVFIAVTIALMLVSCASFQRPPKVEPPPVALTDPTAAEPPAPPAPAPLASGDVRITVRAAAGTQPFRIMDKGELVGVLEAAGELQWDRPSGVVHLQAETVSTGVKTARFLGLLDPGKRIIQFGPTEDGSCDFEKESTVRLSVARTIPRLRRRAQQLPHETAVQFLSARLFTAPAPGVLRGGYADAKQEIVQGDDGTALTWSRHSATRLQPKGSRNKKAEQSKTTHQHPFSKFVDADIKMGMTTRVAFRRNPRDIKPVKVYFRMTDAESLGAKQESLLVALLTCCPVE